MARDFTKPNWLDAVTATQVTAADDVTGTRYYGLQVNATGGPSLSIAVEGSMNGTNWFKLIDIVNPGDPSNAIKWSGAPDVLTGPVKYVRLNLYALSGGTSPTVSASVVAV